MKSLPGALIPAIVLLSIIMGAVSVLAGTSPPQREPTVVEACTSSWNNSTAKNTCSNVKLEKVMNYRCRVTADCQNGTGGTSRTWKVVERNDANRLVNCSGRLKLDNC